MSESGSILVVDDNPSMTKTLVDILTLKGYFAHAAYSGNEALKILDTKAIDIMITDVRMPDMNGVQLYQIARKSHPDIITLLMTAYTADDIIEAGMREGIKTILTKPLDIDVLLMFLSATINTYRK